MPQTIRFLFAWLSIFIIFNDNFRRTEKFSIIVRDESTIERENRKNAPIDRSSNWWVTNNDNWRQMHRPSVVNAEIVERKNIFVLSRHKSKWHISKCPRSQLIVSLTDRRNVLEKWKRVWNSLLVDRHRLEKQPKTRLPSVQAAFINAVKQWT